MIAALAWSAVLAGDAAAASAQLRVASRLASERSDAAPAAFDKVVALDPGSPLADDALLELARFYRVPEAPEQAASLDDARASAATAALTRLVEMHPSGERAAEAFYLRAMVRLAPLAGRDPEGARGDLIEAAARALPAPFVSRARAALGALDEDAGTFDRAAGAYGRVIVEGGDTEALARAAAGQARTLARAGRFGEAAATLQRALPRVPAESHAPLVAIRGLAVRGLLRARSPEGRWSSRTSPLPSIPGPKGGALLVAKPGGGFVVYDRKSGALHSYDATGRGSSAAAIAEVSALAVDPFGRVHAAAGESIVRLDAAGPVVVASLGPHAPAAAFTVDAAGALVAVDRKGTRVVRKAPGATAWEVVREGKGSSLTALARDRGRLIAADEKTGGLVAIVPGREAPLGSVVFRRPESVAVDAAGQIAVLDAKQQSVTLLDPAGAPRDVLSTAAIGVARPVSIAFEPDGSLLLLDGDTGAITRVR